MKVLMLNGSPHARGNTYLALHEMEKEFEKAGIETELVCIGNRDIRGCIACNSCYRNGKCAFDDAVNELAPKFEEADGLVVGSPVYYASANATLVACLDRLFYSTGFDKTMKVGAAVAVGRIAFPIYCFLITEGFTHTHNAKKYALRLGVFALLSEIPFDLAFYHSWFYTGHQNVFFTLLLGLLAIMSIDYFEKRSSGRWTGLAAAFCFVMLGDALRTDYGAFGVFFIVALYAFRGCGWLRTLTGCLLVAWETPAPLAFIPIQMYNGKKGKGKQGLKFFFYAVYPLHLLLLYGICTAFFW